MPTGMGIVATQAEAVEGSLSAYLPDPNNPQFDEKTFVDKSGTTPYAYSGYATTVGTHFYGKDSSLAPAVAKIDCYEANNWLQSGFLHYGYCSYKQPGYTLSSTDKSSPSQIANHSWVGDGAISDILRRLDFIVETDEFIQVVAPNNGSTNKSLLASAFNTICAGRSDGGHSIGTFHLDSAYTGERTKPDLVVPREKTSYTAPLGASAAAILIETGRNPALSSDPSKPTTSDRNGETI